MFPFLSSAWGQRFLFFAYSIPKGYQKPAGHKGDWHFMDLGKIRAKMGEIVVTLPNSYQIVSSDAWSDRTYFNSLHPNCKYEQGLRGANIALAVNGEAVLMYPPKACFRDDGSFSGETVIEGPVSSMRAEHLRDGIEDYEYFAMLKRLDANNPLLASYAEDTEAIERHRLALAREIERLNMKGK